MYVLHTFPLSVSATEEYTHRLFPRVPLREVVRAQRKEQRGAETALPSQGSCL